MIIALCSPAMGAGKTEIAHHLVASHGFTRVRFASPMKRMTAAFLQSLDIDAHTATRMIDGDLKAAEIPGLPGITPRHVMQTIGTEWGRDCIHPDLWTTITRNLVERLTASGQSVVIDDMRFPNEYAMVTQALGGRAIRVVRPGIADTTGHASEGQLNGYPMEEVLNDGGISHLMALVDRLVSRDK